MLCTPKTSSVNSHSVCRHCRWNSIFLLLKRCVVDEISDYFLIIGCGIMMRCSRCRKQCIQSLQLLIKFDSRKTDSWSLYFIALFLPPCNDRWPLEPKRTHQARPRNDNFSFQISAWNCTLVIQHQNELSIANINGRSSLQTPELRPVTGSPVRQSRRSFLFHDWIWLWKRTRMRLFQDCWEPWLVLRLYDFLWCIIDDNAKMRCRIVNTGWDIWPSNVLFMVW